VSRRRAAYRGGAPLSDAHYTRVATLKTARAFRDHLAARGIDLPFDERLLPPDESPFARPFDRGGVHVGNRFCVLPMEGWDGTADGEPGELTRRRWRHFGESGAKLIWGGEAVAVRHDGRANPNQLLLTARTQPALASLREDLVAAHRDRFGANADGDLYVGLQLTHSGRFARPNVWNQPEPRAAYAHPVLDARFPAGVTVLSDDEIDRLVEEFVEAARRAWDIGFHFVDIKHCHGYFLHELLSAVDRPGKYGGCLENRARFLFSVVDGIRAVVPKLGIGVRLSVVDSVPYRKGPDGRGVPEVDPAEYRHGFGVLDVGRNFSSADERGSLDRALDDSRALLRLMRARGIRWVCVSAGSPYYCPHLIRPALFPPLDGYLPPEEPLAGVARHVEATARLKADFPDMVFVGSGYTYLQEWLPHVAHHVLRTGMADFVGIGRLVLSYPGMPADLLAGRPLQRKQLCRTFSDCTTGPRLGLVSGCYPLDSLYADHPHAAAVKQGKAPART
jgi:2,4-dienoyl-CoA reductase-like NADH-dependent reductase (Old Yellow Enzyme family)